MSGKIETRLRVAENSHMDLAEQQRRVQVEVEKLQEASAQVGHAHSSLPVCARHMRARFFALVVLCYVWSLDA